MKISLLVFFFLQTLLINAQDNFTITGKIDLLTSSKTIVIGSSYGEFKGNIGPGGEFNIHGNIRQPGVALINTDSSGSNALWLEPGDYVVKFTEVRLDSSRRQTNFRILNLNGPVDAQIFHRFSEWWFYLKGNSQEERREKANVFCLNYIDSILLTNPKTKVLPEILRRSRGIIGDMRTKEYMSLLNEDQVKNRSAESITEYFNRKAKIEKEVYFTNFEMKNQNGKTFKFSSLNNKLILLDFWASWCAPCRRKHPRLIELYNKYSERGFAIVSIALDENKKNWKRAIKKDSLVWFNVSELKGWRNSIAEAYFINSIPFSIWLDKDKKIILITELTREQIEKYLE